MSPLAILLLLPSPLLPPAASGDTATTLRLDPRLLAQAAEVWGLANGGNDAVWPGWDVSDTPLLFYFPGEQEVLINHPHPPEGFVPYHGPLSFPGWTVMVHDGDTIFDIDGQNTSREVAGIPTLVVADTLSNLRPRLLQWMRGDGTDIAKEDALDYSMLAADPYDQMGMILHEAFHVFQGRWGAGRAGNETALLRYPSLSIENNVGFALEARALSDALTAKDEEDVWMSALRWLAIRKDRRAGLSGEASAYEDGTEFNEGLAKYVEWAMTHALEGREPGPAMAWVRGFAGYGDMAGQRDRLLAAMRGFLSGEYIVNEDPYGASGVRFRLYWSGMAIGALLDGIHPEWKERMMKPGTTLTGLVEEVLLPEQADLDAALAEARDFAGYAELVAEKTRLREDGARAAAAAVEAILHGEGTLLTVDYSGRAGMAPAFSFTPFGITRVDEGRTIYGMVPVRAMFGAGNEVEQTRALPVLHDGRAGTVQFRMPTVVTPEQLAAVLGLTELTDGEVTDVSGTLPFVRLQLRRAIVRHEGGEVVVELR